MGMSAFTLFRRAEDATGSGADARARRGIFSKERWRKKEEGVVGGTGREALETPGDGQGPVKDVTVTGTRAPEVETLAALVGRRFVHEKSVPQRMLISEVVAIAGAGGASDTEEEAGKGHAAEQGRAPDAGEEPRTKKGPVKVKARVGCVPRERPCKRAYRKRDRAMERLHALSGAMFKPALCPILVPRPSVGMYTGRHMNLPTTRDERFESVSQWFHVPIQEASEKLRVCPTILKKICRGHGVKRWPYRQVRSIARLKGEVKVLLQQLEEDECATGIPAFQPARQAAKDELLAKLKALDEAEAKICHPMRGAADPPSASIPAVGQGE